VFSYPSGPPGSLCVGKKGGEFMSDPFKVLLEVLGGASVI